MQPQAPHGFESSVARKACSLKIKSIFQYPNEGGGGGGAEGFY